MIVPVDINRDEYGYWTHPALLPDNSAVDVVATGTEAGVFCDDHA